MRQDAQAATLAQCVQSTIPTLVDIKQSHGIEAAQLIVEQFVSMLFIHLGMKDPTGSGGNDEMKDALLIENLVESIYEYAYDLNLFELHEFFKCISRGKYGAFYGSIDSEKVGLMFDKFWSELQQARLRIRKEQEEQCRREAFEEAQKNGVSMPESTKRAWQELTNGFIPQDKPKLPQDDDIELCKCPKCDSQAKYSKQLEATYCPECNYFE